MSVRDRMKTEETINDSNNAEQPVSAQPEKRSLRDSVKSSTEYANRSKPKKEHFLWVKMWINYLVSMTMKDRGKIPDNIGDRILITNNMYITKLYMSTIVQVYELGQNTPVTLMEILCEALRDKGNKAILDMTCKNTNYEFDPKNSGLQSRIRA